MKPLECPRCDYFNPYMKSLEHHIRSLHRDSFPLRCMHCAYQIDKKRKLLLFLRHLSLHRVYEHSCPICFHPLSTKSAMKNHVLHIHEDILEINGKEIICRCGSIHSHLDDFLEHLLLHKQNYILCKVCNVVFRNNESFANHTHDARQIMKPITRII